MTRIWMSYQEGNNIMKDWLRTTVLVGLIASFSSFADNLQLNGIAVQEQLRKEYYIGALYLETLSRDPAAIIAQTTPKRMVLRVTADRWSPMQFAQHWNQMILINNGGSTLNANVMDVLNFTNAPKSELVAGDELAIELERGASIVTLNGTTVGRTNSPILFNMLINTWIGARPPSSEFKRDILALPNDKTGAELRARFDSVKASDARRKMTSAWGIKETEAAPTVAAAAPPAAPAPTAKPKNETPPAVAAETKKAPAADKPATTAAAPAAASATAIAAAPKTAEPKPDPAVAQQKHAQQQELYADYSSQLRRLVYKNIVYPKRAVKQNREGLVVIKVSLTRDGALTASSIAQSADDMLDEAAMEAIKKGAPFPAVNEALDGVSFDFLIPVVFKLTTS
jgi:TonB family protein